MILSFGGQAGNNLAKGLHNLRLRVLGTSPAHIDEAEDRFKFSRALDALDIKQPAWVNATSKEEATNFCKENGYPCLIRPSYVLSGVSGCHKDVSPPSSCFQAAMNVAHNERDLHSFLEQATHVSID